MRRLSIWSLIRFKVLSTKLSLIEALQFVCKASSESWPQQSSTITNNQAEGKDEFVFKRLNLLVSSFDLVVSSSDLLPVHLMMRIKCNDNVLLPQLGSTPPELRSTKMMMPEFFFY